MMQRTPNRRGGYSLRTLSAGVMSAAIVLAGCQAPQGTASGKAGSKQEDIADLVNRLHKQNQAQMQTQFYFMQNQIATLQASVNQLQSQLALAQREGTAPAAVASASAQPETPMPAAAKKAGADAPATSAPATPATPVAPANTSAPAPAAAALELTVDPALPAYVAAEKVSGRLRSVGSDTMDRVMQGWGEAFITHHDQLRVFSEGKGSSTAVPSLAEGVSDIGPMSRPIKEDEIKLINSRFGYDPTQLRVAVDALAIYVHPSNPVVKRGLTLAEIDAIFSSTRSRGLGKEITRWGDLGLTGEWADRPIILYGRNKVSGTASFFREEALKKGDFRPEVQELVGSEALVSNIAANPAAVGYSGIGYRTPSVAIVPIRVTDEAPLYMPDPEPAYHGQYPLARYLYLTIAVKPGSPLPPVLREFLTFVYSAEAQKIVAKDGYYPLAADIAAKELAKVGLTRNP